VCSSTEMGALGASHLGTGEHGDWAGPSALGTRTLMGNRLHDWRIQPRLPGLPALLCIIQPIGFHGAFTWKVIIFFFVRP
jgi:hypothetical protein